MAVTATRKSDRLILQDNQKKPAQTFGKVNPTAPANNIRLFVDGIDGLRATPIGYIFTESTDVLTDS